MAPLRALIHIVCTSFDDLSPLLAGIHSRRSDKGAVEMSGVVVFKSLRAALTAGYQIYGKTDEGYLARTRTNRGWALALVVIAK